MYSICILCIYVYMYLLEDVIWSHLFVATHNYYYYCSGDRFEDIENLEITDIENLLHINLKIRNKLRNFLYNNLN